MKAAKRLRVEFLKTMIQLATAGFGLAAALAWNSAIQEIIKKLVPADGAGLWSQVVYALVVTAIAVIVTYTLGKMLQDEQTKEDKEDKDSKSEI